MSMFIISCKVRFLVRGGSIFISLLYVFINIMWRWREPPRRDLISDWVIYKESSRPV